MDSTLRTIKIATPGRNANSRIFIEHIQYNGKTIKFTGNLELQILRNQYPEQPPLAANNNNTYMSQHGFKQRLYGIYVYTTVHAASTLCHSLVTIVNGE